MSDISGAATIDTSGAVAGLTSLMASLGNVSNSSFAAFAGLEELGSGLEDLGDKILHAVGSAVSSAVQIQSLQAGLTQQTYNFGESLSQNQAQAKGMTDELMRMATSMKLPTTSVLQLARVVASFGYSGEQIPMVTKAFAEFASVTGTNANIIAPIMNKVMQQFRIPVGDVNNLTSAVFNLAKNTSGGAAGILNMADRLGTLGITTGFSVQQFLALAATAQDVDARIGRGGAASALAYLSQQINTDLADRTTPKAQAFFAFMGTSYNQMLKQWQQDPFSVFTTFLTKLGTQRSNVGAQTLLTNMGFSSQATIQGIEELAQTTETGGKSISQYLGLANQGWKAGTDVQTAYQATLSTTAANMIALRDTVTQLSTKLSADLLPVLSDGARLASFFADTIGRIPAPVLAAAAVLATLTGGALVGLGALTRLAVIASTIGDKIARIRDVAAQAGGGGRGAAGAAGAAGTSEDTVATEADTAAINQNTEAKARDATVTATDDAAEAELGATVNENTAFFAKYQAELAACDVRFAAATAATEANTAATAESAVVTGTASTAMAGVAAGLGIAGVALVGASLLWGYYTTKVNDAKKAGREAADSFSGTFDTSSLAGINDAISQTTQKIEDLQSQNHKATHEPLFGVHGLPDLPHRMPGGEIRDSEVKVDTTKGKAEIAALQDQVKKYQTELNNAAVVSQKVFGDTSAEHLDAVLSAAASGMGDLTTNSQAALTAIEQVLSQGVGNALAASLQNDQQMLDSVGQAASSYAQDNLQVAQSADAVTQAQIQESAAAIQLQNVAATVADAQNKVDEANTQVAASALSVTQAQIQEAQAARQLNSYNSMVIDGRAKLDEANQQVASSAISLIQAQIAAQQSEKEQQLSLANATLQYAQAQNQARAATTSLESAQFSLFKTSRDYAVQYQQALNSVADTTLSLQQAQISAANAQWQLTYLQEEGASQRDIQMAQLALAQANQQVTDTQTNLTAAQQKAQEMPTDHALALAQAQEQLASAQNSAKQSALGEQQAQLALYTAQKTSANNLTVRQAIIALKEAFDRQKDSAYGVVTAQIALDNLQDGSIQLQYQQALLGVTASQQKLKDANYQVITAQEQLNLLQQGSVQLQYHQAVLAVTAAQLQNAQAVVRLEADTSAMNGQTLTAYQQAQILGNMLASSTNPQIHQMGLDLLASIAPFQGVNDKMLGVAGSAQTVADNFGQVVQQVEAAANAMYALNVQNEGYNAAASGLQVAVKAPRFAAGAYVTHPTLGIIGEAGPELILPLNDIPRMMELLRQAGLADVYGNPLGAGGTGGGVAPVSSVTTKSTVNHFYLQAITQPTDPDTIMNEFAWKQRLVLA